MYVLLAFAIASLLISSDLVSREIGLAIGSVLLIIGCVIDNKQIKQEATSWETSIKNKVNDVTGCQDSGEK